MKRILILAMFIGMMTSCSNDENELSAPKGNPQLELAVKNCVDEYIKAKELQNNQVNGQGIVPPPPGFDICDCVTEAADTYGKPKNTK